MDHMERYRLQVGNRPDSRRCKMERYIGMVWSAGCQHATFTEAVLPLGSATLFTLRWDFYKGPICHLTGYKAGLDDTGLINLTARRVCHWDFAIPPQPRARRMVLDSGKRTTFQMALQLDAAVEEAALNRPSRSPAEEDARELVTSNPAVPEFWGRFSSTAAPSMTRTYGLVRDAMLLLRRGADHEVLYRAWASPGGTVGSIDQDEGRILVRIEGQDTVKDIVLPGCALLRSGLKVGTEVEAGAMVALPAPPGDYTMDSFTRRFGQEAANTLLEEVFEASAVRDEDTVTIPLRYCQPDKRIEATVFEDVRHLCDVDGACRIQVVPDSWVDGATNPAEGVYLQLPDSTECAPSAAISTRAPVQRGILAGCTDDAGDEP